jgi:hypothetical protein
MRSRPVVAGHIRRRVLVNALVDPDEAARRLPAGLVPHVPAGGTVIGCCLLELEEVRPGGLPAWCGVAMRAAAHRISVEWHDELEGPIVGVYVPERHTDSRLAVAAGGRWFPGVHRPAQLRVADTYAGFHWTLHAPRQSLGITVSTDQAALGCDPVAGTCLGATVGLSPGRRGQLEGVRMRLANRVAHALVTDTLESSFLATFASATPAPTYVMEHVDVRWEPAPAPRTNASGTAVVEAAIGAVQDGEPS